MPDASELRERGQRLLREAVKEAQQLSAAGGDHDAGALQV
jgi:hypothetical protein